MTARAILRRFGLADAKLPGNFKVILEVMDRLSGRFPECHHSAATIARHAQCCERTARNAIAALRSLGVVEVVIDYGRTTRRRIVLLWKKGGDFFASVAANADITVAANLSPEIDPPPDPPIVEPEGNTLWESGGECAAEADPAPPPGIVESPTGGEDPTPLKASPEQVDALVDRGRKVLPSQPREWFTGLARRWSLRWVLAALGRAEAKRAEGGEVRTGYVVRTLEGFKAEGGPPAELSAPELTEEESLRRFQALLDATPDTW